MEGPLSAVAWLMIIGSSAAGAWVYLAIRPYDGHWVRLVGMFIASASVGATVTPGVCEFQGWTTIYQHILVAFGSSLLGMPVCKAAVSVTESEAVNWIKKIAMRVIGFREEPTHTDDEDKAA